MSGGCGSLAVEGQPGDSPLTCRCETTQAVNRDGHSKHSPLSISVALQPANQSSSWIRKKNFNQVSWVSVQGSLWGLFATVGGFSVTVFSTYQFWSSQCIFLSWPWFRSFFGPDWSAPILICWNHATCTALHHLPTHTHPLKYLHLSRKIC